ncbi:ABC transporter permease [Nocardiopsis valliformis]|uniref:ABC transporter permease n=1 Tax=Nocardiopsis valliformis TaxID=239974 RepID=UPI0003455047|nr:ABC transporter permease [Nocardiopsis valliformis]
MSARRTGISVARRLPGIVLLLLAVSAALFWSVEVLPGDPASQALGAQADPERVAALRERLGLDRPVGVRYLDWLSGVLTGDLGESAVTGLPVAPLVADRAARSLVLGASALLVVVLVAVPAGVAAGARPGALRDRAASLGALLVLSVPEFVLAALVVSVLAHGLGWFPPVSLVGDGFGALTEPDKLVLPTLTLAAVAGAFVLRLTRAAVAEAAGAPHVEAARLAGVPEHRVLARHLLPSVRGPVAQAVALAVPYTVGGALVVEAAFGYPGLGALTAEAIGRRDAAVVSGAGIVLAGAAALGFLVAELAGAASPDRAPQRTGALR